MFKTFVLFYNAWCIVSRFVLRCLCCLMLSLEDELSKDDPEELEKLDGKLLEGKCNMSTIVT